MVILKGKGEPLFKRLNACKQDRNKYKIKWEIDFWCDTRRYYFSFLPTVTFLPWIYRHPNSKGIFDIWWLNFHIMIGLWTINQGNKANKPFV